MITFLICLFLIPLTNPNIVILSVPPGIPSFGVFAASRLFRKAVVFDYRDEWEEYYLQHRRHMLAKAWKRAVSTTAVCCYKTSAAVLAVTEPILAGLKSNGVATTLLVPNGADVTVFKPSSVKGALRASLGLKVDDFVLVYAGSTGPYYRLDIVFKALAAARQVGLRTKLLVLASGDVAYLRGLAARLGITEDVIFVGPRENPEEVANIICCGDVGLLPYDANPLWMKALPAKFFEYGSCGLPVIACTSKGSLLDGLIRSNRIGRVVEPLDYEALGQLIVRFTRDRADLQLSGSEFRKLVQERYDRRNIAAGLLKSLQGLASHSRLPTAHS
jgi:glycosyltransferase involved in cell wall biosynthesis